MKLHAGIVARALPILVRPVLGPPFPVAFQRLYWNGLSRISARPHGVSTDTVVLGERRARRFDPPERSPDQAVLWLHGGAFLAGSFATHGSFAAALARAAGTRVYLLDYRLAPEHRHPAAVEDALSALSLIPESTVVLGGDSAGGMLALLAALERRHALAGLALVSPLVDATLVSGTAYQGKDVLVRTSWGRAGTAAYFGHDAPDLREADLSGLPPMVIHVGEHERLRQEDEDLAALVDAEFLILPGMWHDSHLQCDSVQQAARAVQALGRWISDILAPPT